MTVRIWRTGLDPARVDEYERFAAELSAPMFAAQPGFVAATFAREGARAVVVTAWRDRAAAEGLASAPDYQRTVARLSASGLLAGEQTLELFDVHAELPDRVA